MLYRLMLAPALQSQIYRRLIGINHRIFGCTASYEILQGERVNGLNDFGFYALGIALDHPGYGGLAYRATPGILGVVVLIAALAFRALPRLAFVLPYYWIGSALDLIDTRLLVIITLVAVNQPFTIWMLRSFFMEIPKDLEESAMVDGANRLVAFLRVIIPIMWPGIIATALFTLLLAYNEFLLVRILTQLNWTLPVGISRYTGGEDPRHLTLAAAASVSATIPIIIVILFFQKQLVKGLAAGAVKG